MTFDNILDAFSEFISKNGGKKLQKAWEEKKKEMDSIIKKEFNKELKKKVKKAEKKKKAEGAPKGVRSAYIHFCMEMRPRMPAEMDTKTKVKSMGNLWNQLKNDEELIEEFQRFKDMEAEDKKRYNKEKEEFLQLTKEESSDKSVKMKTATDKRAKTAYLFFCDHMRPILKEEDFSGKELMTEMGKRWKELKEDEDREDELAKFLEMAENAKNNVQEEKSKKTTKKKSKKVESDQEDDDDDDEDDE